MWVEKRSWWWCLLIPGVFLFAYFRGASATSAQQPRWESGDWLVRLRRASPDFGQRVEKTGGAELAVTG